MFFQIGIQMNEVKNLWTQEDLALERLDIRGVPIESLWPLKYMSNLRELIITQEQQSLYNLKIQPEHLRIVVRPRS